jgi:hypothetical protein
LVYVFITPNLNAQKVFKDAGMWNTIGLKHKFNKKWALLITEEFRLKENYSQVNLTYTEVGIEYTFNKSIKTSLTYRNIQKYQYDNPLSFRNRLQWDIGLKKGFGKFGINYRHRLQAEVKDYFTSENGHYKEWFSRHKVGVKYDISEKWKADISGEYRIQLSDPRSPEYDGGFHRQRYQAGLTYKINTKQDFGFYYLYQNEFNIQNLTDIYILGLEYSLEF